MLSEICERTTAYRQCAENRSQSVETSKIFLGDHPNSGCFAPAQITLKHPQHLRQLQMCALPLPNPGSTTDHYPLCTCIIILCLQVQFLVTLGSHGNYCYWLFLVENKMSDGNRTFQKGNVYIIINPYYSNSNVRSL